jgi:protein tyrosine/serine phosphatase
VYSLQGIANFRDFGGHPTNDGRRVVEGRLFRGGHQGAASPSDRETLDGLGIGLIVDLRRSFECAREPRVWPASGSVELVVDTEESSVATLPYVAFLRKPGVTPDDVVAQVRDAYRSIPYDSKHVGLYSRYLRRLATADCASLVSCTHGKDRTGILCALTLRLLGVDHGAIMEDYLLTNAGLRESMSIHQAQASFANTYGITPTLDVMSAIVRVEPDFLETAFEEMRSRNGSVDGYLDMLGIIKALREEIRARYVS